MTRTGTVTGTQRRLSTDTAQPPSAAFLFRTSCLAWAVSREKFEFNNRVQIALLAHDAGEA